MTVNQLGETVRDDYTDQPQVLLMEDESSVAEGLKMVLNEESRAASPVNVLPVMATGGLAVFNRDSLVALQMLPPALIA